MQLNIDPEFKNLLAPLTKDEYSELEKDILENGCEDTIKVWNGIIVDGHNRYSICLKHGLIFDTQEKEFDSRDQVKNWMIRHQLARRNQTPEQISYFRGKLYEQEKKSEGGRSDRSFGVDIMSTPKTAERIANEYGVDEKTIRRDADFAKAIDTIGEQVGEDVKHQILSGELPVTKKDVVKLAQMPEEKRQAITEKIATGATMADAIREEKRAETKKANEQVRSALEIFNQIDIEPKSQFTSTVWKRNGHIVICGDNTDILIRTEALEGIGKIALAFADPPYNSTTEDWDGSHTWQQDFLGDIADVVAVTPGISSIQSFMQATKMPYKWSTATWITNGMARGALGFGNWIYTAIFSSLPSLHRNEQDFARISIKESDKFDQHILGAKRQKPPEYLTWLFSLFAEKDDVIFDPFAGSGTSVIVADRLGMRCVAIEKDYQTFCDVVARLDNYLDRSGRD